MNYTRPFTAKSNKCQIFRVWIIFITIFCVILPFNLKGQRNKPRDLKENLRLIETLGDSNNLVYQTIFTSKGQLFSVKKNRVSNRWSYRIGQESKDFLPCPDSSYKIGSLSLNDKFLAISCEDFTVEVWNLEEVKRLSRFLINRPKDADYLWSYISNDGKRLLTTSLFRSDYAQLWDVENARMLANLTSKATDCDCNRTIFNIGFSPNDKTVAASFGGMIFLWDAKNGKLLNRLIDEKAKFYGYAVLSHKGAVSKFIFTKDGKTIISGAWDGTTKSWDVATGNLLQTFKKHNYEVESLALSPDEKILATGSAWDDFQL